MYPLSVLDKVTELVPTRTSVRVFVLRLGWVLAVLWIQLQAWLLRQVGMYNPAATKKQN